MKRQVKAKPNSRQHKVVEEPDGSLTAYLKAPPTDGKANEELVKLLAEHFGVSKSCVRIQTGRSSRSKLVEIDLDDAQ